MNFRCGRKNPQYFIEKNRNSYCGNCTIKIRSGICRTFFACLIHRKTRRTFFITVFLSIQLQQLHTPTFNLWLCSDKNCITQALRIEKDIIYTKRLSGNSDRRPVCQRESQRLKNVVIASMQPCKASHHIALVHKIATIHYVYSM